MKVLLVDGPRAGAVYDLPDGQPTFVVPVPREVTAAALTEGHPWDVNFETALYRIVPKAVWLFGGYINCATVATGQPSKEDLIEVLLSDEAKEALS